MVPASGSRAEADQPTLTVTALSRQIEAALAGSLPSSVQVEGEVANHTVRNGHHYWTLRDDTARIDCVMWASDARRSTTHAVDGAAMVVTGTVVHWAQGGRTQLKVRTVTMAGEGQRLAQLRARCDEYRARGLFDDARKQPLPTCPRRIAVLTAKTGAAVHDVIATAQRRFPACSLLLVDIPVQGPTAAGRIAEAVRRVDAAAEQLGLDAIILTRGGGSIEDLWAFNEPGPADAVIACRLPVVAAIGHESDTTLVELVADQRASTPTQAVMLLLPDQVEARERAQQLDRALHRGVATVLQSNARRVDQAVTAMRSAMERSVGRCRLAVVALDERLRAGQPEAQLARRRGHVAMLQHRCTVGVSAVVAAARQRVLAAQPTAALGHRVDRASGQLTSLERTLHAVGPESVLLRGYSLTLDERGQVVRRATDVQRGDLLETRTGQGSIHVRVEHTTEGVPSQHGTED